MSANQPSERLHALDAVRGFALILGIVFHATASFLVTYPGHPIWVVTDKSPSLTLSAVFFVLHIFRMTTFFLIAGFFAHLTFHRRGAKGFILDRLKRIALPLVSFWPILFGAIVVCVIWGAAMANGGVLPKSAPAAHGPWYNVPLTHLWFLYVLLWLYAAMLAGRGLVALFDRQGRFRAGVDKVVAWIVESPVAPIILAAPLFLVFATVPGWRGWFGIPTPDSSLIPNLAAIVGFGTAFGFGFLVHRQPDLIKVWERRWVLNLVLAISFTVAALALIGVRPTGLPMAPGAKTVAYAAVFTLSIWTWTFAMIGMALRFLSGFSPMRRYIADASYWLYLIHFPIVLAGQVALSQLAWPWFVKFPLILVVAFPIMFLSYNVMVRYSFIGWMLNGRRQVKPGSKREKRLALAASATPQTT